VGTDGAILSGRLLRCFFVINIKKNTWEGAPGFCRNQDGKVKFKKESKTGEGVLSFNSEEREPFASSSIQKPLGILFLFADKILTPDRKGSGADMSTSAVREEKFGVAWRVKTYKLVEKVIKKSLRKSWVFDVEPLLKRSTKNEPDHLTLSSKSLSRYPGGVGDHENPRLPVQV